MTRVAGRPPVGGPLGPNLLDRPPRREQVVVEVRGEELPHEGLRLRAQGDHSGLAPPAPLVLWWPVQPDGPTGVYVAAPGRAGFAGPAPGQPLELDQSADVAVEVGEYRIDHDVLNRTHRIRLPCVGPASLEPGDRDERLVDRRGH